MHTIRFGPFFFVVLGFLAHSNVLFCFHTTYPPDPTYALPTSLPSQTNSTFLLYRLKLCIEVNYCRFVCRHSSSALPCLSTRTRRRRRHYQWLPLVADSSLTPLRNPNSSYPTVSIDVLLSFADYICLVLVPSLDTLGQNLLLTSDTCCNGTFVTSMSMRNVLFSRTSAKAERGLSSLSCVCVYVDHFWV